MIASDGPGCSEVTQALGRARGSKKITGVHRGDDFLGVCLDGVEGEPVARATAGDPAQCQWAWRNAHCRASSSNCWPAYSGSRLKRYVRNYAVAFGATHARRVGRRTMREYTKALLFLYSLRVEARQLLDARGVKEGKHSAVARIVNWSFLFFIPALLARPDSFPPKNQTLAPC